MKEEMKGRDEGKVRKHKEGKVRNRKMKERKEEEREK